MPAARAVGPVVRGAHRDGRGADRGGDLIQEELDDLLGGEGTRERGRELLQTVGALAQATLLVEEAAPLERLGRLARHGLHETAVLVGGRALLVEEHEQRPHRLLFHDQGHDAERAGFRMPRRRPREGILGAAAGEPHRAPGTHGLSERAGLVQRNPLLGVGLLPSCAPAGIEEHQFAAARPERVDAGAARTDTLDHVLADDPRHVRRGPCTGERRGDRVQLCKVARHALGPHAGCMLRLQQRGALERLARLPREREGELAVAVRERAGRRERQPQPARRPGRRRRAGWTSQALVGPSARENAGYRRARSAGDSSATMVFRRTASASGTSASSANVCQPASTSAG